MTSVPVRGDVGGGGLCRWQGDVPLGVQDTPNRRPQHLLILLHLHEINVGNVRLEPLVKHAQDYKHANFSFNFSFC